MKTKILSIAVLFVFMACKKEAKQETNETTSTEEIVEVKTRAYPENINKVFKAHRGLDKWNTFENLVFNIKKPNGDEKTTTNLKNRTSLIETSEFKLGFNGKDVWLKEEGEAYKGNARFYYNLMFYFYAMPFVVADDGIIYENVDALKYNDVLYPGVKISYQSGIGESPDDEYIVYFNPESHKMEWLAYTVTYFSKEKSKDFHLIKYNTWEDVNGVLLPKILQWYSYKDGEVGTMQKEMVFENVMLSTKQPIATLFEAPEGATIIE